MNSKEMRDRQFAIMKSRSHTNNQLRDIYQEAHLRNADRHFNLLALHTVEMEVFARLHADSLELIANALTERQSTPTTDAPQAMGSEGTCES